MQPTTIKGTIDGTEFSFRVQKDMTTVFVNGMYQVRARHQRVVDTLRTYANGTGSIFDDDTVYGVYLGHRYHGALKRLATRLRAEQKRRRLAGLIDTPVEWLSRG